MKTSIVTGANTGIGAVTAKALAERGDRVILACRSEEKTRPVIDEIVTATGNDAVEFLPLDLADLDSVRTASKTLLDRGDPINVLVANAGLAGHRGITAQGFEIQFGVNHLGHFAFVTDLLELLKAGAPARVVVVASMAHEQAKNGIDYEAVRRSTPSRLGFKEYGVSKLANVLFTQELARRYPPEAIWTASLHPGAIASDVWRRIPQPFRALVTSRMPSVEVGARTSIMCATDDEVLPHHGGYYSAGKLAEAAPHATPERAAELWERSEAWVAT